MTFKTKQNTPKYKSALTTSFNFLYKNISSDIIFTKRLNMIPLSKLLGCKTRMEFNIITISIIITLVLDFRVF